MYKLYFFIIYQIGGRMTFWFVPLAFKWFFFSKIWRNQKISLFLYVWQIRLINHTHIVIHTYIHTVFFYQISDYEISVLCFLLVFNKCTDHLYTLRNLQSISFVKQYLCIFSILFEKRIRIYKSNFAKVGHWIIPPWF